MLNNLAVLVGNGLSIAFNPDLNLQTITREMLDRVRAADGDDVILAMQEMAERALPDGVTSADDFEKLVGAFGAESRTLTHLEDLARLTQPKDEDLLNAIRRVADFAERVRDVGLSHVLEVIFERSHAYWEDAAQLHSLVESIVKSFPGRISFGNLNYDTLLLAALLTVCQSDLCDMGHGWRRLTVSVDGIPTQVPALRRFASDFPESKRVRLLHLHGSLTYWGDLQRDLYVKISKEVLDDRKQWRAIRDGTTDVRPVVVLSNQRDKSAHVTEYPFSLAYEVFGVGLSRADHWLVIGYSFKDEPVNSLLRSIIAELDPRPRVLVVTYGEQPSRHEIERSLGWNVEDGDSSSWLLIDRQGANGAQNRNRWTAFTGQ